MKADVKIEFKNAPFSLFLIHPSLSIIRREANGTRFLMGEKGKQQQPKEEEQEEEKFFIRSFLIQTQLSIQVERSRAVIRERQIYEKDREIQDPSKQTTATSTKKGI